jgi:hypothetical protein
VDFKKKKKTLILEIFPIRFIAISKNIVLPYVSLPKFNYRLILKCITMNGL